MNMSQIRNYLPDGVNNKLMFCVGQANCYLQYFYNNTFSASEITDNIFVGDLASASNIEAMKEQGITHILTIMNGAYELYPNEFSYKIIHINDDPWVDITQFFEESNKFIDEALSKPENKIMIHCHRGISRSVTLLIAYKLFKLNELNQIPDNEIEKTIENVLIDIKNHRTIADPNKGFLEALKIYIQKLNGYQISNNSIEKSNISAIQKVPLHDNINEIENQK